ncbi:MAG TPA: hypothetical protein PKC60_02730 [Hydrogenophaga sp.]|uniref:hypothetical protein n=1 Tax=Hydrogenophaga sp. TaxID=1904254 RepID=UPI002C2E2929|nr:hypothetical protein [Hydrogenophaga sp.]HMN92123.1 hypothetical protein [Hydrogenophaga sp.]HMP10509.1 hypothetical protein [Hydrogenophaga sp.]
MPSRLCDLSQAVAGLSAVGLALALVPVEDARALEISDLALEGEIKFFSQRPDPQGYRYESNLRISQDSLSSGLVGLSTCHRALDPNARVVIAFNPQRVRHIAITSSEGVGDARVVEHRVELSQVQRGGSICIDLVSQALERTGEGRWRLHAGPLMRRYLDGYLPMQASLSFQWPEGLLNLRETMPGPQPGVQVARSRAGARIDLVFAGRLNAALELESGSR